ncbi:hypothetical protein [Pandoraea bronchicola]|uniref:hypothetical protein n=1 Tax=Pandoraea bronchicola TaxID=2508287 RepID=UPI001581F492|nr:hypothetical protein [Pandoraea bronchicola]
MTQHLFRDFPVDEQDDARETCKRFGFVVEDFEIIDEDSYPAGGNVGAIRRQVTVRRLNGGQFEIFEAGHGSAWTVDFEAALESGAFGAAADTR